MTANQSIQLYEFFKHHLSSENDALRSVQAVEAVLNESNAIKASSFTNTINDFEYQMAELHKKEMEYKLKIAKSERFFNLMWLVPIVILFITLLIIISKLQ